MNPKSTIGSDGRVAMCLSHRLLFSYSVVSLGRFISLYGLGIGGN